MSRPENLHVHEIEGGFILHAGHDLGEGAESLDPIPHEGHQHLMALIARNYVNEISGPAESVRRGVESGTIKGKRIEHYCVEHEGRLWGYPNNTECTFQRYQRANLGQPAETPCDIQQVVVIPGSDGGSER